MSQNGLSVQNDNHQNGSIRLVDLSDSTAQIEVPINEAKPAEEIPVGAIVMFKGDLNSVPNDWKFCDGSPGTPDLRGKFVLGATFSTDKQTGGHSDSQIPTHNHVVANTTESTNHAHTVSFGTITSEPEGKHTHVTYKCPPDGVKLRSVNVGPNNYNYGEGSPAPLGESGKHNHSLTLGAKVSSKSDAHGHTVTVSKTSAQPTNGNFPPYYELAYIIKVN